MTIKEKLIALLEGQAFVEGDYIIRFNKEIQDAEVLNFPERSNCHIAPIRLRDVKEWKPYNEVETYKRDDIEFTVRDDGKFYELQFQKFPDELRVFDDKLGDVEGVEIFSRWHPFYNKVTRVLLVPGCQIENDGIVVEIPKSQISLDFFKRLLNFLHSISSQTKPVVGKLKMERQAQIVKDCKNNNACVDEYKRLNKAFLVKNYSDFIECLKDNLEWCLRNKILLLNEINYVKNYKPETQYLTYEELIEIAGERYKDLVFDYKNETYIHDYITVNSGIWFRSNGRNSLELPMLNSYVQIGLAKVYLKTEASK